MTRLIIAWSLFCPPFFQNFETSGCRTNLKLYYILQFDEPFQFGFKGNHIAVTTLLNVNNGLRQVADHEEALILILFHFSATFDAIDRFIFIEI